MNRKKISDQKAGGLPVLFGLLVASAVYLSPELSVQRCAAAFTSTQGPLPGDETTTSFGAFQIQVDPAFTNLFYPTSPGGYFYPGFSPVSGILTSPVGYDGATTIGVSANHNYVYVGNTTPGFPVTIGGAGMSVPLNKINNMAAYFGVPSDPTVPNDPFVFPTPITGPDEVFTEIESFNLRVSLGEFSCGDQRVPVSGTPVPFDMLTAGPDAGPGAYPSYVTNPNLRSIGKVQQYYASGDTPAVSFFDIFVNGFLPSVSGTFTTTAFPLTPPWPVPYPYPFGIAQFTNGWSDPLVIEDTNVTELPPHVVYIHGQTPAVPVHFKYNNLPYWQAGDLFGYITLAGHGVLGCTNHQAGTPGGNSNCCSTVSQLLDETFGPVGSPLPGMPVPWVRPTNTFPTPGPNTTLLSLVNSFTDPMTGIPSVLDDTVSFQFNISTVAAVSDLLLGNLTNPVAPPTPNNTATYTNPSVTVSFNLSFNGSTPISCVGTGAVAMVISNTGLHSTKIYYTNPPPITLYTVQLQSFSVRATSIAGPFFLRVDPAIDVLSLGQETIQPAPPGYSVSFFDDTHLQLSTDGVNYLNAIGQRTLRLLTGLPANSKAPGIAVVQPDNTHIVLNWIGGATLQSAFTLSGSNIWTSITSSNAVGPFTNPVTGGPRFFRLKIP